MAPADSCLVGVSAIDDSDVSTVTVAANDITTAAVTPVSDDDMLIVVGSADAGAPARTWTETGSMTERFEGIGQTLHCLIAEEAITGGRHPRVADAHHLGHRPTARRVLAGAGPHGRGATHVRAPHHLPHKGGRWS